MPLAVVNGDLSLGHCWPPATALATLQTSVFVNNRPVVVVGDKYYDGVDITKNVHPGPCPPGIPTHQVKTVDIMGSKTVFIELIQRPYREGDLLSCGDVAKVNNHSSVFIDGLGAGPN